MLAKDLTSSSDSRQLSSTFPLTSDVTEKDVESTNDNSTTDTNPSKIDAIDTKANGTLNDKIAVIGAGWSGLTVLKELKAYGFKNVRILEENSGIGGQWNLKNQNAQTWSDVRANISKLNMHYPDFPYFIDPEAPLHATINELYKYLEEYVEFFKLKPDIQFSSKVSSIKPIDSDNKQSSKWSVEYVKTDEKEMQEIVETFDRVVVCTGRFGQPKKPTLPGNFTGEVKVLTDVKNMQVENKRMIVIGNSISATDIMEFSCINGAQHITCVYRTPRWYASLWLPDGTPFDQSSRKFGDMDLARQRLVKHSSTLTQYGFKKPSLEDMENGKKSGGSLYRSFEHWVKKGKITGFHGSITNCDGKNVTLSDGSVINDVDIIMCATGFNPDIPILPREIFKKLYQPEIKERRFLLYLLTFVPGMYDQSLAFVGAQPIVESNPTMFELQARLIGHYWSDVNRVLPHESEERQGQWIEKNIITLDYSPLLPDICKQSYHIADEIAEFIGCKPKDPEVISLLEDAGFIPEQFRIEGPHANPNALSRLKWKLQSEFKDTPQNILKHMRVNTTTASVNLYFNKLVFTLAKPFLDYQEKKARRSNRDKEIEKQKF